MSSRKFRRTTGSRPPVVKDRLEVMPVSSPVGRSPSGEAEVDGSEVEVLCGGWGWAGAGAVVDGGSWSAEAGPAAGHAPEQEGRCAGVGAGESGGLTVEACGSGDGDLGRSTKIFSFSFPRLEALSSTVAIPL
jgi:hypothetical protein